MLSAVCFLCQQFCFSCVQFYAQGVFDWSGCSSTKINHAILLIGYGSTNVDNALTEYWLLKNRWEHNTNTLLFVPTLPMSHHTAKKKSANNFPPFPFLHSSLPSSSLLPSLLQLWHWLGRGWLHEASQESVQPMWHCIWCSVSNTMTLTVVASEYLTRIYTIHTFSRLLAI